MDIRREEGIALIVALMAMLLMTALGAALMLTTSTETIITGNFRNSSEALYAADAVLERAMDDLLTVPDWNSLLTGAVQSAFIDGPPSGERTLPDGSTINLTEALNVANCEKISSCTAAQMDANSPQRPWGLNNPRWRLYAYGNLKDVLPTDTIDSAYYVVLFVADDPSESDNNPLLDGGAPVAPSSRNWGTGILAMRAEAFGPRGARKVIELTIARTDTTELERGYNGQRGQDEQNRRTRKPAVQTPGKTLQRRTLNLNTGGIS